MMKKMNLKTVLLVTLVNCIAISAGALIISSYYKYNNKYVLNSPKMEEKNNDIAILLETGSGTKTYKTSSNTTFPTDGYKYNAEKSYCLNGSTLTYDEANHQVSFSTDHAEKCYMYFDAFSDIDNIIVDKDPNMVPIMYTETCSNTSLKDSTNGCWVKADATNKDATYGWFDYGNHKWANAVTLKSDKLATYQSSAVGTPIDNNDVMGYFVYIPRYSYKLFNVNS
jgi:hypothetical protein